MQFKLGRSLLAMIGFGLVAACESPTDTLMPSGPQTQYPDTSSCDAKPSRRDQYALFQIAYYCAWDKARTMASGGSFSDSSDQNAFKVMLREGLGLVRGNCSDFFRKRGDNQQQINLGRDIVAMGGATAAAIVGLTGGSALALSIIAVSGATLYAGIDTYTKNFLFGADNIEAVRTLTMTTLKDNATTVVDSTDTLSFQYVADAIMDNQEMCKPAAIAAAVRLKLRGGSGAIEAAGEDPTARGQLDAARMQTIGAWLGLPGGGAMDETRLAAACWATTPEGSTPTNLATIKKWLPLDPYKYGPDSGNWPGTSARVAGECFNLSSTMQAVIKKKIDELKASAGGQNDRSLYIGTTAPTGASPSAGTSIGPRFVPMRVR